MNELEFDEVEILDIIELNEERECYDLTVEDDNSFCISLNGEEVITHNCDGQHIIGLMSLLFSRFWPELL